MIQGKHIGLLFLWLLVAASWLVGQEKTDISGNLNSLSQSLLQNDRIEFRYISVPEDYDNRDGRILRLAVVIIKAESDNPLPDPVIFLSGGPGAKAILEGNITRFLSHKIGLNRDIILMDFRGIGLSEPAFCPDIQREILDVIMADYTPAEATQKTLTIFERCFENLAESNVAIDKYSSTMVAKDLDSLRKELKIDQWNLWGVSYGTRLAQTYIRDFPEAVRSVIFDSPVPMGYPFWGEQTYTYQKALSAFFNTWNENPACRNTFPNLEEKFFNAFENLRNEPIVINYKGSPDSKAYLNFQDMHLLIHQMLYSPVFYPAIPWIIESLDRGNFSVLEILLPHMGEGLYNQSDAIFVSVLKNDNNHILSTFETSPSDPLHNALNYFDNITLLIKQMESKKTDSIEALAVYSDIPAFIIAGSFDPITAPYHARILQESFSNNHYIEFPGQGHALSFNNFDAIEVCAAFFDNPVQEPKTNFLSEMKKNPVNWVTDFYFNPGVFRFGQHFLRDKLWNLIVFAGLLMLTTAIGLISLLFKIFQRNKRPFKRDSLIIELTSLPTACISIIFFTGLGWFTYKTMQNYGIIVLLGLVKNATSLLYLPYLILPGAVIAIYLFLKISNRISINQLILYGLLNLSVIWSIVVIFIYRLFP